MADADDTVSLGDAWFARHHSVIQENLWRAVNAAMEEDADDAIEAIARHLRAGSHTPAERLMLADDDESTADDRWSLLSWIRGAGAHRVIAAALQRATHSSGLGTDAQAALAFVRRLRDRDELSRLLSATDVTDGIVDLVWREVLALQAAGAATSDEVQSKFSGAIELSYGGLEQFFGGLEAVTGSPSPNVDEAMEAEHLHRGEESTQTFVTGN